MGCGVFAYAHAETPNPTTIEGIKTLAEQFLKAQIEPSVAEKVQIQAGELDPRLKLRPCTTLCKPFCLLTPILCRQPRWESAAKVPLPGPCMFPFGSHSSNVS